MHRMLCIWTPKNQENFINCSGTGIAGLCMRKDWTEFLRGCKRRNDVMVTSKMRQVLFQLHAFMHFMKCFFSNFLYFMIYLVCNMGDRFKDGQDWCIAFVFLLEILRHPIALRRSQKFSALQRIIGPVLVWHSGYVYSKYYL